jgi:hypothetical protein
MIEEKAAGEGLERRSQGPEKRSQLKILDEDLRRRY